MDSHLFIKSKNSLNNIKTNTSNKVIKFFFRFGCNLKDESCIYYQKKADLFNTSPTKKNYSFIYYYIISSYN